MSVVIGLESYPTGWGEVGVHEGQRTLELRRRHLATNRGPLVATGDTRVQVGPTLVGARLRRRPSGRRVLHSERLYGWPNRSKLNISAAAVEGGVKNNNIIFKTLFTQLDIKPIALMYKLNTVILMYKVHHHFPPCNRKPFGKEYMAYIDKRQGKHVKVPFSNMIL